MSKPTIDIGSEYVTWQSGSGMTKVAKILAKLEQDMKPLAILLDRVVHDKHDTSVLADIGGPYTAEFTPTGIFATQLVRSDYSGPLTLTPVLTPPPPVVPKKPKVVVEEVEEWIF